MELHVRLGVSREGKIRVLDLYTLSNTGAYGEHGPTTVGLSGHKSIPLYTGGLEAYRFSYDVVYTNLQPTGACRGYGATQGIFAVESAVNELAETLGMDPAALREKNIVRVDVGSATIRLGDDGCYNMTIGAADMGTGCDTILAQMAAELLGCAPEDTEVVDCGIPINPALAHAIYRATGVWHRSLPITPEKIALGTPDAC